jgi:hypothetical protein
MPVEDAAISAGGCQKNAMTEDAIAKGIVDAALRIPLRWVLGGFALLAAAGASAIPERK